MTATIEERVTALEIRMDEQERLRASQDGDLSIVVEKLRAQDRMLQALAATQSEHTRTLGEHTRILGDHTRILGEHTRTLAELTVSVDEVKGGVTQIIGMLDTLIERDGDR